MTSGIIDLADETLILPALEQDRVWASYALCDLDPPHRSYARFVGTAGEAPEAVVLVYSPPGFTSLLPCGESRVVRRILEGVTWLPASVMVLARKVDLPAVETRYRLQGGWTMLRMAVTANRFQAPSAVNADLVRLTAEHIDAVQAFYAVHPETVFTRLMLQHGVYYGARVDGNLVAVAGTHAVSRRHGAATIGNVFTLPEYRGRGLATATTAAVAQTLLTEGACEVTLNVREDNAPAIAAYRRLGFTVHLPFWEGKGNLR